MRRNLITTFVFCLALLTVHLTFGATPTTAPATAPATSVQQWDIFELTLPGTSDGNPFVDVTLSATFSGGGKSITAHGFYDGGGVYKIRFMPPSQGKWEYQTKSNRPELTDKHGEFTCEKPAAGNHGPVYVSNTFHFAYADGTTFIPISTTIYGWVNQRSDALQEETLATLKTSPFNRVRMMVLPIKYGDDNEPKYFPFETNSDQSWNGTKFDPRFFQHIEQRLVQLRDMGIEAELILFHNRDSGQTGFDKMPPEVDDRYLRYVVARFSAYRNVWWNLANEFDSLRAKTDSDWDRFFQIIQDEDPVQHVRGIHQEHRYYDFNKPWVSYMSVQSEQPVTGFGRAVIFRTLSEKPVVFDEVKYEGDIPQNWGRLNGAEMTERFWYGIIGGTYVTHGETFSNAPGIAWISRGGKLIGESPKRIAFLKEILASAPPGGLNPIDNEDQNQGTAIKRGEFYLIYFGDNKPTEWTFELPAVGLQRGMKFHVDVLDTWNMTITPIEQPVIIGDPSRREHLGANPPMKVPLPGKAYIALRIRRVD